MSYTVSWTPQAEAELARVWNAARDRAEVTIAAREIDIQLRADPLNAGESRELGTRVFFATPLAVTFHVSIPDRLVRVVDLWRFRQE
ncbi:MAG: hypothetical protein WD894_14785 [Pirellulales bacterium]